MKYKELLLKTADVATSIYCQKDNSFARVYDDSDTESLYVSISREDSSEGIIASFNYGNCLVVEEGDDLLPVKRYIHSIYDYIEFPKERNLAFDRCFQLLCEYYACEFALSEIGEFEVVGLNHMDTSKLMCHIKTPTTHTIQIDSSFNYILALKNLNNTFVVNYIDSE